MSIFDDIGDAFKKMVDGIRTGMEYVIEGVVIVVDTVEGAVSTAAKATAHWVEGAAFVVVREVGNAAGAIFLKIDDRLRHVPNPATYDNLFRDWSGIGDFGNLAGQRRGEPLTDAAYLASGTPDGKVFLILDNAKRWIGGPPVMDRYHFKWQAIRKLPASQLAAMADGPTLD